MAKASEQSRPEPRAAGRVQEISPALARALFSDGPPWLRDFANLSYEWRRLIAELFGTFFLVLVAAGAGIVDDSTGGQIGRAASVVAPALMVLALILATGAISGAHLNPVVTVAFFLRREFPLRRIPGYLAAQVAGGLLACCVLWSVFGRLGTFGATLPGAHVNDVHAMAIEAVLTLGLVSTILGTASGAQNVGPLSAIAVGGYIALAGLWASPVSGASMNPVRSLAPDLITGRLGSYWVYLAGPAIGMAIAVAIAYVLRGPGGDPVAIRAAQGSLGTVIVEHRQTPPEPG